MRGRGISLREFGQHDKLMMSGCQYEVIETEIRDQFIEASKSATLQI